MSEERKVRKCVGCGSEVLGEAPEGGLRVDFPVCDTCKAGPYDRMRDLVGGLVDRMASGQISGLIVLVKNPNGTFETGHIGVSYVERLGLLEAEVGKAHYEAFAPQYPGYGSK